MQNANATRNNKNVVGGAIGRQSVTLNPKTRFLEQKELAHEHRSVVTSEAFQRACEAALTSMLLDKPAAKTAEESAALGYALEGAREFLRLLMNIAEQPAKPPERPSGNLIHKL